MEYQSKQAVDGNDGNDWGGRAAGGAQRFILMLEFFELVLCDDRRPKRRTRRTLRPPAFREGFQFSTNRPRLQIRKTDDASSAQISRFPPFRRTSLHTGSRIPSFAPKARP